METIANIAQKLLMPFKYLGDIPIHTYLTELTWLLLLKIAPILDETQHIPKHLTWKILTHKQGIEQYEYYQKVIKELSYNRNPCIAGIYANAHTSLTEPEQLTSLITNLAILDMVPIDELGEIYATVLEKCANFAEENSLYIAPRALIELMVVLTQPQPGELFQDPLAGTANLIVAADQYIRLTNTEIDVESARKKIKVIAIEPNLIKQRLGLMNCLLNQVNYAKVPIHWGDSLLLKKTNWPLADVILSVLVFANEPTSELYKHDASLALLQHINQTLKPGGRAAVILPDNVLKATGPAQRVRTNLLNTCVVHTILRLPNGIFYPHKLPAHILFFQKGQTAKDKTEIVWFYDSRTRLPNFGQNLPLTREHLRPFEMVYGDDPLGQTPRLAEDENGHWRCFSRENLAKQGDRLDLCWLQTMDNTIVTEDTWKVLFETTKELETLSAILQD